MSGIVVNPAVAAEQADGGAGVVLRLRPIVHASPTPDGIHVRGSRSSFTMNGGAGLWRLWQALAIALTDGRLEERLPDLSADPAVQAAVKTLVQQLREHDMLIEVPPGWGETWSRISPPDRIARWLEAVAPDPLAAWTRIQAATIVVHGTGPVAACAVRALEAAGVRAMRSGEQGGQAVAVLEASGVRAKRSGEHDRQAVAVLDSGEVAVAAGAAGEAGFVTPVGAAGSVSSEAEAIAARIGMSRDIASTRVLAALVGGAAAHRLVCALAGLPDPSQDELAFSPTSGTALAGLPTVLVARLDPLRAEYRPWLGGETPTGGTPPSLDTTPTRVGDRNGLDDAMDRIDALCDPETGVLPPLDLDDLPQVPAGLARCRGGDLAVCGVGVDAAAARLAAALGAAEHAIGRDGGVAVVVGADRLHAEGSLLRRAVHRWHRDLAGKDVAESQWALDAQARSWWKAVTLRFGIPAEMRVRRLDAGVFHAELRAGEDRLGWAVEHTAADAAAICALNAAGALQWQAAGAGIGGIVHGSHAAMPPRATISGQDAEPWEAGAWIWPAQLSVHEPDFQGRMLRVLGAHAPAATPVAPYGRLTRALAAVGFVVLEATP
ncbi:hypothetical protein [Streptosporangium sp. NPDC000396]|uniref:hypothetical protein n=1 Tax=Streptosporangium sp. NPDC000396 TaxID=3366185 RepID=UPI003682F3BC